MNILYQSNKKITIPSGGFRKSSKRTKIFLDKRSELKINPTLKFPNLNFTKMGFQILKFQNYAPKNLDSEIKSV
jgi:hypothetical protein